MKVLYQGSYLCSVKRLSSGDMKSETKYLGTDIEASGSVVIETASYLIKEAKWEICRSPGDSLNGMGYLPELIGVEAYFNAGKHLSNITLNGITGKLIRELMAECIRGAIQAETYVFRERGFSTTDDYEQHWRKTYGNSCRYYNNLGRVTRSWFEHIGDYMREKLLFNRNKSMIVYRQNDGIFGVTGIFIDSFHELNVRLAIDGKGEKLISVEGNFLRAPDKVCFENEDHLLLLAGKSVFDLNKKELAKVAGGPEGCFHLVDITNDALVALRKLLGK